MASVKVGSLRNPADAQQAAQSMRDGQVVGVLGRSVASLWVDPTNEEAVEEVYRIKGEKRIGKPLGMVVGPGDIPRLIDRELIAADLRPLFLNGDDLAARLSTLIWIRFPLHRDAAAGLPDCLLSTGRGGTRWAQGWITDTKDVHGLLAARLVENGVRIVAPTSMNVSGEPEIVTVKDGEEFCDRQGIALFLRDPDDVQAVQGSYPIIEVNRDGVRLVREGHFASFLLDYLLGGVQVHTDGYRPAKFSVLETHSQAAAQSLPAYQLHDEIQARLNGSTHPAASNSPHQ